MNQFILKKPIITEKSYALAQNRNAYTFEVALHATKGQIREAIESTFKVNVTAVRTTRVAGKIVRTGAKRQELRMPDRKKAIVSLKKDQKIALFDIDTTQEVVTGDTK